jgi:nucleotide-binding universal stress UspA family protein
MSREVAMLKMLIGVDGSEHALRCIDVVASLSRKVTPVEAVLINVRDTPLLYGDLPLTDLDLIEQGLQKQQVQTLDAALERARACGLAVAATRRARGLAAPEIVRAATECGADQIVLCTRGMGALGNLLLGSVAQRVVHLADVPVLLVK